MLRIYASDLDQILNMPVQVSSKVVLEAHDIPRHKSGDMPVDMFWLHDEYDG